MVIQNLYNANLYQNYGQNYGFNQSVNNFYQQQPMNIYGGFQQQQPVNMFGGYQQQSSPDIMSLFSTLLSSLFGQGSVQQAQPAVNTQQNDLSSLFSSLLGVNINNSGSIGNVNIGSPAQQTTQTDPWTSLLNSLSGTSPAIASSCKTPATVDETSVEVTPKSSASKPEKVYIVGSYATAGVGAAETGHNGLTLEDNVNDFSGVGAQAGARANLDVSRGGTSTGANDADFQKVLAKVSPEDKKNLSFNQGQAYIISESGKILGTASSDQLGDKSKLSFWKSAPTIGQNANFKVVGGSLGLEDSGANTLQSWSSNQESTGGKIELDGQTYEVASSILRKHSPLTFDLNGDGVKTSNKTVNYDINGDGKKEKINDVADGTLSIRGGKSGKDLFGDNTDLDGDGKADGFKDGFEALKALAKKEGLINGKSDMKLDAQDLRILENKYQLGMKTGGYNSKEKSLASLGINEIDLSKSDKTQSKDNFDGQNNTIMQQEGATFTVNGKKREYADIWHASK